MMSENFTLSPNENNSIPSSLEQYITDDTIVVRSPGRINLIGEHTDYNEGYVLPAAINKSVYIALTPREDNIINLYSVDYDMHVSLEVDNIIKQKKSWPNYILGVVVQYQNAGIVVPGFDAAVTGDIPMGAGLSSSAALECATAIAINDWLQVSLSSLDIVKLSQKAEHEFAGVKCGIMDQFASVHGKKGHVFSLDCRTLEYEYKPLQIEGYKLVLLDTSVKHALASSEYNVRRKQCEDGVAIINAAKPSVISLRDVTPEMVEKYLSKGDQDVYKRCKYIVEENNRLLDACGDLENGDIAAFGEKMFETHTGLSKLFEVSCPELDYLVEAVESNPYVVGARMMGGGFGGCTLNIVKEEIIDDLIEEIRENYKRDMGKDLKAYIAETDNGTEIIRSPVAI